MDEKNDSYVPKAEHRDVEIIFPEVSLAGHSWVPIGPMLKCMSCPYEHSQFIPPNMKYLGLDKEGMPMLKKV